MAPEIIAELGPHRQYFEPFCGSMAVLFAKEASAQETVNDLHGDLINLAMVLQCESTAADLYERLMRTIFHESLLEQAQEVMSGGAPQTINGRIERAYWYFLASWMCRSGMAGTRRTDYRVAVRWTFGGGSPTVRLRSAIDSVPWWHRRLQNVVILNRDAFEIIPKFADVPGSAIYIDSPYAVETRTAGGGNYLHEFNHAEDHERLAIALSKFQQARVVVSYYDCPRIRELYSGWTVVDCERRKNIINQHGTESIKSAPEILLINGESLVEEKAEAAAAGLF